MKISIVLPCHNEEAVLEKNIREVAAAVKNLPHEIKIVISDNNSKDGTAGIGKRLAAELPNVDYIFVGSPGKGAAVIEAWKKYDADVYGFMDADLATDLSALPRALEFIKDYDLVIGSRRIAGAEVKRELYRKFTSAILNAIVRILLKTKIKDTPCGFKFMKKSVIDKIVPQLRDRKWVFDTELLILAERAGCKIKEMPVKWEEKGERKSGVNIYPTAMGYIRKILEIKNRLK